MKRFPTGLFSIIALFVLVVVSLYLMSDASQNSARFGRLYIGLLGLNTFFLLALVLVIGLNIFNLVRQVVQRQSGSRLTLRLVLIFVILALVPASTVYIFSIQMLERGIDSWFDVGVERALDDALELSRSSLDLQMRQLRQQTEPMATFLADTPNGLAALSLNDMLRSSEAIEITLFGQNNRIIASSGDITASMVPRLPGDSVLRLVSQGQTYIGLDPVKESGLHFRLVIPVPATRLNTEARVLQVLYPVTERITDLANSVQGAFGKYNELVYLRTPLKQSFILTLSLVLLFGVLFAVWTAFFSSRRLMAPISELAEGTRSVAAGEYHKKLPVDKKDDLGLLIMSFNQMTEKLAEARDSAERSQRIVESQRAHLQTLLQHLSSGVMSFNLDLVLDTVNASASHILGLDLEGYRGWKLDDLGNINTVLERFCEELLPHLRSESQEWEAQLVLLGGRRRKTLMCHGAKLPTHGNLPGGHVVVIDDITDLIQAQRDAAWGEVARRLAHEIKNPLTPIQLSAERLRRKLLPQLATEESRVLDRSTRTIVQQVESMKTMVNAFGDYARTPTMDIVPLDLNELIKDVVEMYRVNKTHARLELNLDPKMPRVQADGGRVRQLLHNLIRNSLEALEKREGALMEIQTRCGEDASGKFVDLTVSDNGPGFPEELMGRLFEPYVTSKPKGNGLGLAIVKKIVEEHGGMVQAENLATGGACVYIRLLVAERTAAHDNRHLRGDAA